MHLFSKFRENCSEILNKPLLRIVSFSRFCCSFLLVGYALRDQKLSFRAVSFSVDSLKNIDCLMFGIDLDVLFGSE